MTRTQKLALVAVLAALALWYFPPAPAPLAPVYSVDPLGGASYT